MRVLINKLKESIQSTYTSPQYRKLLQLRMLINSNASENWTVEKMSDFLHISPGYLQSLYKSFFGISCMDDVICSRIRMAKEYLVQRNYSVSQVANYAGITILSPFAGNLKRSPDAHPANIEEVLSIQQVRNSSWQSMPA